MATFFDMEMDDPRYGPTKPNKKAIRPKPLKRGTRKKRDKELSDKKKMKKLSYDVFQELKGKIPQRVKSPIEKDQDKVFKVIERHNKSLKKSPISISGRKSFAAIPPRTKLIISSRQDEPTDAQAFAYDNDPTAGMAPWQYHNFMLAKRKHDLRRQRFLQHQQQMRAEASDSDDDLAAMSDERRRYQKMKMQARQAKQKETQSGGKRRRKKTRKRKGKGKGKKYGDLKIREIKRPSVKPTTRSSVKTRETVYELDVDEIIEDERKNQELEKRFNTTVEKWKKTPFYKRKKKRELAELANQIEFQLRNRKEREMSNSLIQTKDSNKKHYAKMDKDDDGNVYLPKGEMLQTLKTKKKYYDEGKMRAAAAAPRRIGGRRSRKKKRKKKKKTRRRKAGKKVLQRYTRKKPNALRRTIIEHRQRQARNTRQFRIRRQQSVERFRIQVIDSGQLTQTLISFINRIRRALAEQTLQTRENYLHFNTMYDIVKRATNGVEISQQDRSRIALIGNLLRQFRVQIEPNFDTDYLGESSSSDEEATVENVD